MANLYIDDKQKREATFYKRYRSKLDYTINWSRWLRPTESITSVTWEVVGVTVLSYSNTTSTATIWLDGGTPGNVATAICRIVTNATDGSGNYRTDERTLYIHILSR